MNALLRVVSVTFALADCHAPPINHVSREAFVAEKEAREGKMLFPRIPLLFRGWNLSAKGHSNAFHLEN